jgi:hypothetical protein
LRSVGAMFLCRFGTPGADTGVSDWCYACCNRHVGTAKHSRHFRTPGRQRQMNAGVQLVSLRSSRNSTRLA